MPLPALKPELALLEAEGPIALAFNASARSVPYRAPASRPQELSILSDASMLRWRYGERLDDVLEDACRRHADRIAVAVDGAEISYRDLDARANRMARFFIERGVKPGDRVAVLLDRGLETSVALFALLKARAAYVPLDANHPPERLRYIIDDAKASLVIAHLRLADRLADCEVPRLILDKTREDLAALDDAPLGERERPASEDGLCYVLYTSGTTGHPKGVAIAHPSICNFVRVAAERYGFAPGDRVYQGMSIAFDFSIEELWVPLVAGATLVPNAAATSLFGEELADFLESREVTCFCCVPTLLASIDRDLPNLRVLLIGGEACPPALVKRWDRADRFLLNSYGPTETTVTATLGRMSADRCVTIGRPLPTYSIVILDPKFGVALEMGEAGEIGIAGIGVAEGYVNRRELTDAKFIPDFLSLPNNPSGRIYRTGDLGRINEDGEIEYLGRIDTQVKLRGYRIELTEIESVLLESPDIAQVVVTTFEPEPGAPELVAYYSVKHGAPAPDRAAMVSLLRSRLPAYMTPAFLERLPFIPTLVSNKADREKLPAPKSARLRYAESYVPASTPTEHVLSRALMETLGLDVVSVEGDFFNEYGAHSLLMARFCAKIRQLAPSFHVAMRDVYTNPTVRRLAAAIDTVKPVAAIEADELAAHSPGDLVYYSAGAAQVAFYVVAGGVGVAYAQASLEWTYAALASPLELYARALVVVVTAFAGLNLAAVLAKWLLIGRARPGAVDLWSAAYVRFWMARQIIRWAPANAFVGTPIYNVFLRALGARIGRKAVIASTDIPVAADLFHVGDNAVVMKRVVAPGYSARGNRLHFGEIRIGAGGFVGEASVLDLDSSIGDFGQLGHSSSLQSGERVPEGKRYQGSPAEETTTNFRLADAATSTPLRRALFTAGQLFLSLAVVGALADAALTYAIAYWAAGPGANPVAQASVWSAVAALAPSALALSLGFFVASMIAGLAVVYLLPRFANLFLEEGRIYPLYGFHYSMQAIVETFSNSPFFNLLFGDSVFIEPYLRFVGLKLAPNSTTGSNFGSDQRHDNPFLCSIGAGVVASDGLNLGNIAMSSEAFRLGECRIGANSFLGTDVYVPPAARVGENCLFATKTMAPIDGPLRENVGLLGSPSFEIPRAANRDVELRSKLAAEEQRRRLAMKTRHNFLTALAFLGTHWFAEFIALFALTLAAQEFGADNFLAIAATTGLVLFVVVAFYLTCARAAIGFGRLRPEIATVNDPAFWRVERYWKLSATQATQLFAGTPLRSLILRAMGARVGRKVFDDGAVLTEASLVSIADGANLNLGVVVQSHSLEEGVYKSDHVHIGAGAALGSGAFVHYGVTMNEKTRLDADSFLMKGEITPAHSRWRGNPAKMIGQRVARRPVAAA